jgi:hypothetical protein
MGKSVKNELADDGLTSLKYQKVDQKEFPLYTWILVKVPKGKQCKIRIVIQQAPLNVITDNVINFIKVLILCGLRNSHLKGSWLAR